ncbi:MAG: hypothetical protein HQ522_20240 [Bacteroidetes bacterium]|nr:hypothetical protein [Bacteroidota bacterium]
MRNLHNRSSINRYVVIITTVVLGTMISCSPAQKESKAVEIQQQNQVPNTIVKSDTSATVPSVLVPVPATATSNEPMAVNTATTPPELNPAHGLPYHRCDIPVGSPLNAAAPAKPAAPINRTGTSPTLENAARLNGQRTNNPTAPTVANATTTPPKLNPPHGQPFHRCEIPVGSPLN